MLISHRDLYDLIIARLRDWASQGFPQAWDLQEMSDQPTRFVPVRVSEGSTAGEIVVLVNAFPSSSHGTEYLQLQATLSPLNNPEWVAFSVNWDVVADDGACVLKNLVMEIVEHAPGEGEHDIAEWFLARLASACELTNRKVLSMQPTRRLT